MNVEWELSKENIQPLKAGRKAAALELSVAGLASSSSSGLGGSHLGLDSAAERQKQRRERKK